jgi:hypothetical protein
VEALELRARAEQLRAWLADRRGAVTVLGGLVTTSLLVWGALLVVSGGPQEPRVASSGSSRADPITPGHEAPGQEQAPPERGEPAEGDELPGLDDERDPDAGEDPAGGEGSGDVPDAATVVDLHGACRVEVQNEDDPDQLQPWTFPECEHAPLDPTDPDERWIVVVSSFSSAENAQREAQARGEDQDPQLLWSSHYPSLRPELWVVFEGPFPDRRTAREEADRLGAGAYVRLLRPVGPSDETPPASG